jgi:hypothetical protein
VFERLRAAINAALDAATPPADARELAAQMRQATIELRAAVARMRDDLGATDRQLEAERRARDDAARRGQLAAGIRDAETVGVAERFVARHGEHILVLEQKQGAQRAELALAERELADMTEQLQALQRQRAAGARQAPRAVPDPGDDLLSHQMDRAERERAADEQLRELKKRMGK